MLHIHNGDCSANQVKSAGVAGEHLPFRENLMAGPTPLGVTPEDWRSIRARFLAGDDEPDVERLRKDLAEQDGALSKFRDHEEVTLWFEHDLFCQINLIYLLSFLHEQPPGRAKLSLICNDSLRLSGSDHFLNAAFALTGAGRDALDGRRDFIDMNSIDLWLGGAHLTSDNLWRWDEQNRKLVRG